MNITEFIAIAVVGAILSVIVQIIKEAFGTESNKTKLITIALSLVVGGLYVWVRSTPYFETTLLVLTCASAVYALVLKK
jgi:hypothetical protein